MENNKIRVSRLREIDSQIETSNRLLEKTKATVEEEQKKLKIKQKNLDSLAKSVNFLKYINILKFREYGNLIRAMIDIRSLGYDRRSLFLNMKNLKACKSNKKLKANCKSQRRKCDI